MLKYFLLPLFLFATTVNAKNFPLKPFDSLFVRGKIEVNARLSNTDHLVANLTKEQEKSLEVAQVKGSTFVQMNPFKNATLEAPIKVTLYYKKPLKRVTGIQKANITVNAINPNAFRASGSGDAFLKVSKAAKTKKMTVFLSRHSIANLSLVYADKCKLRVGKQSQLSKHCAQTK